jgi:hypothetical protein
VRARPAAEPEPQRRGEVPCPCRRPESPRRLRAAEPRTSPSRRRPRRASAPRGARRRVAPALAAWQVRREQPRASSRELRELRPSGEEQLRERRPSREEQLRERRPSREGPRPRPAQARARRALARPRAARFRAWRGRCSHTCRTAWPAPAARRAPRRSDTAPGTCRSERPWCVPSGANAGPKPGVDPGGEKRGTLGGPYSTVKAGTRGGGGPADNWKTPVRPGCKPPAPGRKLTECRPLLQSDLPLRGAHAL